MAGELLRAIGIDEGPHTAAESRTEASRGKRAEFSRTSGQRNRLADLIAKKYLCVGLRVIGKFSYTALITLPERVNTLDRPEVFADEMEETVGQRDFL